ncbi:hypothetical protein E2I00_001394 [Balaenoptera physalus]|uniref:Annexin-2 receptor n=1 Tax=Balaenoptera physalus TaxID=9770 RepID=A0A643AUC9_BALPH|nr:hypothetical protein E2I00_001394 [Balaenoptera physalus]
MEPNFPRCVREAWDSAEESQEPEMLQILSLADPEEWQLPFYPTLGQLSGDDEDIDGEQLSTPCGQTPPDVPRLVAADLHAVAGKTLGCLSRRLWTQEPSSPLRRVIG